MIVTLPGPLEYMYGERFSENGKHNDLVNPYNMAVSGIISDVFATDKPCADFQNPRKTSFSPTFQIHWFGLMAVGGGTPGYTLSF